MRNGVGLQSLGAELRESNPEETGAVEVGKSGCCSSPMTVILSLLRVTRPVDGAEADDFVSRAINVEYTGRF